MLRCSSCGLLEMSHAFVLPLTLPQISRRQDKVAIEDGRRFDGPVELVSYHQQKADGLFVRLTKPICRRPGVQPRGYRFISHADMQKAMKDAAIQLGYEVRARVCVCVRVCTSSCVF